MTVRLGIDIEVTHPEGQEPTAVERGIADGIAWLNRIGPHTAAWHEVVAHLALMAARDHWRQADLYRRLDEERAARQARLAARREAKGRR